MQSNWAWQFKTNIKTFTLLLSFLNPNEAVSSQHYQHIVLLGFVQQQETHADSNRIHVQKEKNTQRETLGSIIDPTHLTDQKFLFYHKDRCQHQNFKREENEMRSELES